MPTYSVPAGRATAERRDKGSRFLAVVAPAADETAAAELLRQVARRHPDATHHCWAWRLGWPPRERRSDAGEPAGTAGAPILRALAGAALCDVVAVVVRWYGGTKLGKGGLVRAYGGVTRQALAELPTRLELSRGTWRLTVPYADLGAVQRLVHPPWLELVGEEYGEQVTLTLAVAEERQGALRELAATLAVDLEEVGVGGTAGSEAGADGRGERSLSERPSRG